MLHSAGPAPILQSPIRHPPGRCLATEPIRSTPARTPFQGLYLDVRLDDGRQRRRVGRRLLRARRRCRRRAVDQRRHRLMVRPVSLGPRRSDPKARESVTAVLPKRSSACFGESAGQIRVYRPTGPCSRSSAQPAPGPRRTVFGPVGVGRGAPWRRRGVGRRGGAGPRRHRTFLGLCIGSPIRVRNKR